MRPLLAPVFMRDALEGDRPIELRPSVDIWLALEAAHGGSLGALFIDTKIGRVSMRVQIELLYRCARNAGSSLKWAEMKERVHAIGLYESTDVVLELFADAFRQRESDEPPAEGEGEGEGGEGVPLASGG